MNISPTLDLHPENHFQFAPNTDSNGCCCCWKSKTVKEFHVNSKNELEKCDKKIDNFNARILSNRRLAEIIKSKFEDDPIENNLAFEKLCVRINENFDKDDSITHDRLYQIINAIYEMKKEIRED